MINVCCLTKEIGGQGTHGVLCLTHMSLNGVWINMIFGTNRIFVCMFLLVLDRDKCMCLVAN